jgi:hypothetical protein
MRHCGDSDFFCSWYAVSAWYKVFANDAARLILRSFRCAAADTTEHRARVAVPDQSGRAYPLTGRPIKREQCPSPERRSREGRVAQRRAFRQRMRPVRYCYPRPMRTPIGAQQTSPGPMRTPIGAQCTHPRPMRTPIGAQGQSSLQQRLPTGQQHQLPKQILHLRSPHIMHRRTIPIQTNTPGFSINNLQNRSTVLQFCVY